MTVFLNRVKMTSATTGTGTLTLGSAVSPFQTVAAAGGANSDVYSYLIEDGTDWEVGVGTYTSSGTTLSRGSVQSTNAGSAINCTGNQTVTIIESAADMTRASTTDVLTGTGTVKQATPDAIAALWEQGSDISSAGTI